MIEQVVWFVEYSITVCFEYHHGIVIIDDDCKLIIHDHNYFLFKTRKIYFRRYTDEEIIEIFIKIKIVFHIFVDDFLIYFHWFSIKLKF